MNKTELMTLLEDYALNTPEEDSSSPGVFYKLTTTLMESAFYKNLLDKKVPSPYGEFHSTKAKKVIRNANRMACAGNMEMMTLEEFQQDLEAALEEDEVMINEGYNVMLNAITDAHLNKTKVQDIFAEYANAKSEFFGDYTDVYSEATIAVKPLKLTDLVKELAAIQMSKTNPFLKPKTSKITDSEKKSLRWLKQRMDKYSMAIADPNFVPFKDLDKQKLTGDMIEKVIKLPKFNTKEDAPAAKITSYAWSTGSEPVCAIVVVEQDNQIKVNHQVFDANAKKHADYYITAMGIACNVILPNAKKLIDSLAKKWKAMYNAQKKVVKESVEYLLERSLPMDNIKDFYISRADMGDITLEDATAYTRLIDCVELEVLKESSEGAGGNLTKKQKENLDKMVKKLVDVVGDKAASDKATKTAFNKELKDIIDELKEDIGEAEVYNHLEYIASMLEEEDIDEDWSDLVEDQADKLKPDEDEDSDDDEDTSSEEESFDDKEDTKEDDSKDEEEEDTSDDSKEKEDTEDEEK